MGWLWVGIFTMVALLIYVALHAFSSSPGAPVARANQGIEVDANGWQTPSPDPPKARKSKSPEPVPTVTLQDYQRPAPQRTDPRFRTCALANLAGYGNYRTRDSEYGWYIDRDRDGISCEFTPKVVKPKPVPPKVTPTPPAPAPSKTVKPKPRPRVTIKITVTVTAPVPTSTSPTPEPTETEDPPVETEPPAGPTASKTIEPEPVETATPDSVTVRRWVTPRDKKS